MSITREWLEFLREQFPPGTRVKLREMDDPYHPVEPGMTGSLDFVDDEAQFHIHWDNGRTLPLVLGKDKFSVLPPKTHIQTGRLPSLCYGMIPDTGEFISIKRDEDGYCISSGNLGEKEPNYEQNGPQMGGMKFE